MASMDGPFSTIESTQEFLSLLSEQIDDVLNEVHRELSACKFLKHGLRVQAWQLTLYTTTKLSAHIAKSRKLMSDLTTLRNLLDGNSTAAYEKGPS